MPDNQTVYLTQEGFDKLKAELHKMKTADRQRISQAIADARAQGDLSENAEYDAAKDEQGLLEAKIAQGEAMIAHARVLDESKVDTSKARILSTVIVKNKKTDAEQTYTLVAPPETDMSLNRISIESPIGRGLLGKGVGDVVEITVPAGTIELKIIDITR